MSVPPPGWVAQPAVATAGAPRHALADLRSEDRRALDSKRVRARIVDWLIVAPFAGIAIWEWGWNFGTYAVFQCLLLIFHHVCEVTRGATPGKRLLHLRVARLDDGELPTPRQAAARGVIGIFEFGLIACVAIMCTKGRRRLGDLAAGTVVVDSRRHPVAARPLFAGALTYPVAWAVPAVIACVLCARGDLPGTYRAQADALCAQASRQAPAAMASGGLPGMVDLYGRLAVALTDLHAPHAWSARHAELLRRLQAQRVRLALGTQRVMTSSAPRTAYADFNTEMVAATAADNAALGALGYEDCAR